MMKFSGKGVCGALATGKAAVFRQSEIKIRRVGISDTEGELMRLEKAKSEAKSQLREIYERALSEIGEEEAEIFEIHIMMIEDEDFNNAVTEIIKGQRVNAEYAVSVTGDKFAERFSEMDNEYMKARSADVRDIANRITACLSETKRNTATEEGVIILAEDLSPAETVLLDKEKVLGFVTAYGTSNSHTAILARSMNIPAVVGTGKELLNAAEDGDTIIADGFTGEVFLNPDKETLEKYGKKQGEEREKNELLQRLKGKRNITRDGTEIEIFANIGRTEDAEAVLQNDAGGIGLFRSEFLYLESADYPTEEEQVRAYGRVLEIMEGRKVIIRTLDIGADKRADYFGLKDEENPALGLRAIRLCINRPELLKTQLRALYRASVYGRLGIMFPMITNKWELEKVLGMCREVREELDRENKEYSGSVELGIMVETPAAAIISDILAPMVDFFSVGTNDLIQYTLACDRQNPETEPFCDTHHEAVLRLIQYTADNAHKYGKWIGICGELAADTALTEAFLKMGVDELSVSPSYVLKVRERVREAVLTDEDFQ